MAKFLQRWRWPLGIIVFLIVIFGLFKFLEVYLAPLPSDFNQRKEFIGLLAQIIGGTLVLIGLYLTWRRITASERNVEVAREGQITERFTHAVEQLGSAKLERNFCTNTPRFLMEF